MILSTFICVRLYYAISKYCDIAVLGSLINNFLVLLVGIESVGSLINESVDVACRMFVAVKLACGNGEWGVGRGECGCVEWGVGSTSFIKSTD